MRAVNRTPIKSGIAAGFRIPACVYFTLEFEFEDRLKFGDLLGVQGACRRVPEKKKELRCLFQLLDRIDGRFQRSA
jgi:hypothetical protein